MSLGIRNALNELIGQLGWSPANEAQTASAGKLMATLGFKESKLFTTERLRSTVITVCDAVTEGKLLQRLPDAENEANLHMELLNSIIAAFVAAVGEEKATAAIHAKAAEVVPTLFYATTAPERFDLFSHMSAGELFFVCGDSLVLEALCNAHVDWKYPQTLHIVYLVEKFLYEMKQREGRFHVIFFECNAWIWRNSPTKWAIREAVLSHVKQVFPDVHIFENWWNAKLWIRHRDKFIPEFFMINDGEQILAEQSKAYYPIVDDRELAAMRPGNALEWGTPAEAAKAAHFLHCFQMYNISQKTHVVFTSRLAFKDNSIVAFVARAQSTRFIPAQPFAAAVVTRCAAISSEFEPVPDVDMHPAIADATLSTREAILLSALAEVLEASKDAETPQLAMVTVVAAVIQSQVPLETRAQVLPDDAPSVVAFLNALSGAMVKFMIHFQGDETTADLLDGRLVAKLYFLGNAVQTTLGAAEAKAANALWDVLAKAAPSAPKAIAITLKEHPEARAKPEALPAPSAVAPSLHPLVDRLVSKSQWTSNPAYIAPETPAALTAQYNAKQYSKRCVFIEARHKWEATKDMADLDVPPGVEEAERAEQVDVSKMTVRERKLSFKLKNRFSSEVQKTAASMGNNAFLFSNESRMIVKSKEEKERDEREAKPKHGAAPRKEVKTKAQEIQEANAVRLAVEKARKEIVRLNSAKTVANNNRTIESKLEPLDSFVSTCDTGHAGSIKDENLKAAWEWVLHKYNVTEATFVLKDQAEINTAFEKTLKECDAAKALGKEGLNKLNQARFAALAVHLKMDALLHACKLADAAWKAEASAAIAERREKVMKYAVTLFIRVHKAYDHLQHKQFTLNAADRTQLRGYLANLGLYDNLRVVDKLSAEWEGIPYNKETTHKIVKEEKLHTFVGEKTPRFTLNCMGHLLKRPVMMDPDSRVPFNPDLWQREVLDIVDGRGSAIVCAPTSAGKTFISYYCMKRVLQESNDNLVVYVAPTRALVNQAIADVYARFGAKEYDGTKYPGYSVYGCLGGASFVHKPFKCQVLVTLPDTLETLMMSPLYQHWVKNIKYVIFDEIHCIDSTGNGDVWERLLMMVRCPFVALSATLGRTTELVNWLNRVQDKLKAQGVTDMQTKVHLVPNPERNEKIQRWSDLQKYSFLPTDENPDGEIIPLHPMSCVNIGMLQKGKFPEDLPLVPSETLELYDYMTSAEDACESENPDIAERLAALDPDTYFKKDRIITQSRARQYEKAVTGEFMWWAGRSNNAEDRDVLKMVRAVLSTYAGKYRKMEAAVADAATAGKGTHPDTFDFVRKNLLPCIKALEKSDRLPCLVFNFEEAGCDDIVEEIVTELENQEEAYRNSAKFKKWAKEREELAKIQAKKMKTASSMAGSLKTKDEDGKVKVEQQEIEAVESVDYSIPDILPEYSFATQFDVISAAEFTNIMHDLKSNPLLERAVRRGIGIHHPGISGKQRIHVERLFRLKYLRVVIATETLALGVHSPCRSVVLAGDHVQLNTMQFRQMAGRAGRRGLDWIGHVLFLGVPFSKMQRLMTSDLPVLKGHIHLDPTVQLRLIRLFDHKSIKARKFEQVDPKAVTDLCECLLAEPLFILGRSVVGGELFAEQLRQSLRYSLDHFINEGFVRGDGPSGSLADVISRCLATQQEVNAKPANFIICSLLLSGTLHELTEEWMTSGEESNKAVQDKIGETMMDVLAYLFSYNTSVQLPLEIHRSVLRNAAIFQPNFELAEDAKHQAVLPGLRRLGYKKSFMKALNDLSQRTIATYANLMRVMGPLVQQEHGKDNKLPFSSRVIGTADAPEGPLAALLHSTKVDVTARSQFVALSGANDTFFCVEDLVHSLRQHLFLDAAMIPTMDFRDLGNHDRAQILVNACVTDFWRAESQMVDGAPRRVFLEQYNGLNEQISWYTLSKFAVAVDNLVSAMDRMVPSTLDELTSASGTPLKCCNPDCRNRDEDSELIVGAVHKCLQCAEKGRETFMCSKCNSDSNVPCQGVTADGKAYINYRHGFIIYSEDNVHRVMQRIAGWWEELGAQIGKSVNADKRKFSKAMENRTQKKPKRPALSKPQRHQSKMIIFK